MKTKLIVFDFDGTLGDTRQIIVTTMQDVMRERNLPLKNEAVCASTIGLPLRKCYASMFPCLTAEELDQCAESHKRYFAENLLKITPTPFPYVMETLEKLKTMGITLAIASSRTNDSLRVLLSKMGMESYFTCIIGGNDITHAKPDAEPVLKILSITGFKADETLVIGDMDVDIMMGRNAGTSTCGVTYGNGSFSELETAGADHIIDSINKLII